MFRSCPVRSSTPFENSLNLTRINQLQELTCLNHGFNIILMGPLETGETILAAGFCADDIDDKSYKDYF